MNTKSLSAVFAHLLAIAGLGMAGQVAAQSAKMPVKSESLAVAGYQSASFGSEADVVVNSIKKDFGDAEITSRVDESTGTTIKSVSLKQLPPFNVPAQVNYRFGYKTKALIQIDVVWDVEKLIGQNTNGFQTALSTLIDDYSRLHWSQNKDAVVKSYFVGAAKADQAYPFLFFRGISDQGSMVALLADQVYAKSAAAGQPLNADVSKVKTIVATYQLNAKKPDLKVQ